MVDNEFNVENVVNDIKEQIKNSGMSIAGQYLASPYYERCMKEYLTHDKIVILGSGHFGQKLYNMLRLEGAEGKVICFADNNKERQGKTERGRQILSVEEATDKYKDAYFIITPRGYENELLKQLGENGISTLQIALFIFAFTGLIDD